MSQDVIQIILIVLVGVVVILVFCCLYLVWMYRNTLEKYYELTLKRNKSEIKDEIEKKAVRFVDAKIDNAISRVTTEAIDLVSKNAKLVSNSIKRKTLEKLVEQEEANEQAVAATFDEAKGEIQKYKEEKFEEVRLKINEILAKLTKETLIETLDQDKQDKLVVKAVEDAKQSNLF
jgi:hypothetical protein